jgi:thiosulfate/3-mercaptopyruvate sulfurtransferase
MPSAAVQSLEQQAMNHSTPEHYNTLISVEELARLKASGKPLMVFDCSFDLMNRLPAASISAGPYRWRPVRDLDKDLSAPHGAPGEDGQVATSVQSASGGRHPAHARALFRLAVLHRLCQRYAGRGL